MSDLICPKCNAPTKASYNFCGQCQFDLRSESSADKMNVAVPKQASEEATASQVNIESHIDQAISLMDEGQLAEALQVLEEAASLAPNHATPYIYIGEVYRLSFDETQDMAYFEAAEESFQKALSLDPNATDAYAQFGLLLILSGDMDRAKHQFNKALETQPENLIALWGRGVICSNSGRHETAITDLSKLISLEPEFDLIDTAYRSRGISLMETGQLQEARGDFEKIMDLFVSEEVVADAANLLMEVDQRLGH